MKIHLEIFIFLSIFNHAKSYKSKQVENGRVLYVFALGSRELIDCPIYSPGRRSSQKLKWLHNGESLVQDSSIKQQINGTLIIRMLEKHQGTGISGQPVLNDGPDTDYRFGPDIPG